MKPFRYKIQPPARSIAALVVEFRNSPTYRGWGPGSLPNRERILARFAAANGHMPVSAITKSAVVKMRDQIEGPNAARFWLKIIRLLLDYAVELEWIDSNPARSVKHVKAPKTGGFREWGEHHIARFLDRWPLGTLPNLVMTLELYTAASRADVVRLGPDNIYGDRIIYQRAKMSGRSDLEISIPILPPLAEVLASVPVDRATFLETQAGRPRSAKALSNKMAEWVASAGLPAGLNNHGLRKAQARRLAEAGCTPQQIMAWLGHETAAMAIKYCEAYNRAGSADDAAERLIAKTPNFLLKSTPMASPRGLEPLFSA